MTYEKYASNQLVFHFIKVPVLPHARRLTQKLWNNTAQVDSFHAVHAMVDLSLSNWMDRMRTVWTMLEKKYREQEWQGQ